MSIFVQQRDLQILSAMLLLALLLSHGLVLSQSIQDLHGLGLMAGAGFPVSRGRELAVFI